MSTKHAVTGEVLTKALESSSFNITAAMKDRDRLIRRHQRMYDCVEWFGEHDMEPRKQSGASANYAVCRRCSWEVGASYVEPCGD